MTKYFLFFINSAYITIGKKGEIIGRSIAYIIIIFLYKQIIETAGGDTSGITYIAITQLIIFSSGSIAFDIARDIETKQIEYLLLEPYNYLLAKFTESFASSLIRFIVLGIICVFFTKTVPMLAIFGVILYNLLGVLIGLSAFYLHDIKQLFFLNLTACFAFGGLIVPIKFCPEILQKIAYLTPYPYILSLPAENTISVGFAVWILIIVAGIKLVYKKICYAL